MNFNVTYYNGFWYSSHSSLRFNAFADIFAQGRILKKIKDDLRLLSLLFNQIHVPRSHFLTFHTKQHWDITREYLSSRDYRFFSQNDMILSSRLPYLDASADTERIVERVGTLKWSGEMNLAHIKLVRDQAATNIDSRFEASGNIDSFQAYIEFLKSRNRSLSNKLQNIKALSTHGDTPFLHELFVEKIANDESLNFNEKEQTWRDTNSIYMNTGGLDLGDDRGINLDPDIECSSASNDNSGRLRYLYSSSFIQGMVKEELGLKLLIKFLHEDVGRIFAFRQGNSELRFAWLAFQAEMVDMVEILTMFAKYESSITKLDISETLKFYKALRLQEEGKPIAEVLASLLALGSGAVNPVAGQVASGAKVFITKQIKKWLQRRSEMTYLGGYFRFWELFRIHLNGL